MLKDKKLYVYDLETLLECFMGGFLNVLTKEVKYFEISKDRNDLYALVKFYDPVNIDYLGSYNGLGFDSQVMQFILINHKKWYDKTNLEICGEIYEFVQNLIEDQNYNVRLPFYENQLAVKHLDCYTILGHDGEARRTSLKACEFALDAPNVQEMPIHHGTKGLTTKDIVVIKDYMYNDIYNTYVLLELIQGNTEHQVYKKNDQLELRFAIREEFGIECINYSDIKLGDELMKSSYAKAIKKPIMDLPRKGTFRKYIHLKKCIPDYVEFKTPYFQNLLADVKRQVITPLSKFERKIEFKGRKYTLAKGGLHSDQDNEIWEAKEGYLLEDDDVSSYYPKIVINNKYVPAHLGEKLLEVYEKNYLKRLELKPLAKTDDKIRGICEALKLMLNSCFGKFGNMDSWLYDPQTLFSVTLTGEFSLLMLIEMFELAGINVISANSDGVTTLFPEGKKEMKDSIVKKWQEITNFEIETVRFKKFYYRGVNSYIAFYEKGGVKRKNDFLISTELWKDKSNRIQALALNEYFTNGTNPIEFIRNYKNIYDFCIRAKATGSNYLELVYSDGKKEEVGKMVRYYFTTDTKAPEIFKRGIGTTGKPLNINQAAPNELGKRRIKYFNKFEELDNYQIDYSQYILGTLRIIDEICRTNMVKTFLNNNGGGNQLDLF